MAKKDLDWGNIGFSYRVTDKRYVSNWKDGNWDEGALISDPNVTLNESAGMLQYCQQVFEGMKAYTWEDGSIVCFRPDLNADRMYASAQRIEMPPFPKDRFLDAIDQVVKGNLDWVPPYGSGASLYLRPYEFATGVVIGVKPADEYQFRVFVTPVGPYYKGGATPIAIQVSDFDRAAPHGTGAVKAGLNYAMSLHIRQASRRTSTSMQRPEPMLRRPVDPMLSSSMQMASWLFRSHRLFFRPSPDVRSFTSQSIIST